jgi:hypothetical protein
LPFSTNKQLAFGYHLAGPVGVVLHEPGSLLSLISQAITACTADHPVEVAVGMSGVVGAKHFHPMGSASFIVAGSVLPSL